MSTSILSRTGPLATCGTRANNLHTTGCLGVDSINDSFQHPCAEPLLQASFRPSSAAACEIKCGCAIPEQRLLAIILPGLRTQQAMQVQVNHLTAAPLFGRAGATSQRAFSKQFSRRLPPHRSNAKTPARVCTNEGNLHVLHPPKRTSDKSPGKTGMLSSSF